jgi:hypothetical protein
MVGGKRNGARHHATCAANRRYSRAGTRLLDLSPKSPTERRVEIATVTGCREKLEISFAV